jgi:5-methylthioadenosine/S-adenosylhomocysteine deaminase
VEETRTKRGLTPVQALDGLGIFAGRTVAAHCVWVNDSDLHVLRKRNVGIAHCPSSNMKLASGIAPVTKMLSLDLAVGLGPDGPAGSNNDFSLFEEMDLAAKLQKVATGDPQAVPAMVAFEMATIRGARALGLEKQIGSLEAGKRADIILVRIDAAHAVPMYNVYSQLVYALKGSDVMDVFVDGRAVVRSRQVLTLDAASIFRKAAEWGRIVAKTVGGI